MRWKVNSFKHWHGTRVPSLVLQEDWEYSHQQFCMYLFILYMVLLYQDCQLLPGFANDSSFLLCSPPWIPYAYFQVLTPVLLFSLAPWIPLNIPLFQRLRISLFSRACTNTKTKNSLVKLSHCVLEDPPCQHQPRIIGRLRNGRALSQSPIIPWKAVTVNVNVVSVFLPMSRSLSPSHQETPTVQIQRMKWLERRSLLYPETYTRRRKSIQGLDLSAQVSYKFSLDPPFVFAPTLLLLYGLTF